MTDNAADESRDIDLTEKGGGGFKQSAVKVFDPEKERMTLAKYVLFGLVLLFLLSFLAYVVKYPGLDDKAAKEVFDFVKVSFPPIVTLILGAYFKLRD
jgi:preprotein translocase subunit SecY